MKLNTSSKVCNLSLLSSALLSLIGGAPLSDISINCYSCVLFYSILFQKKRLMWWGCKTENILNWVNTSVVFYCPWGNKEGVCVGPSCLNRCPELTPVSI